MEIKDNLVSYYVPSEKKQLELQEILSFIQKECKSSVISIDLTNFELSVIIKKDKLYYFIEFIKNNKVLMFKQLIDITAVDYPARTNRFTVVYNLLSLVHNLRIRVKVEIEENQMLESIVALYPAANFFEREVWDLFGIKFANHPDLRRILTDVGFEGHPLRKDFPITGFMEVIYDEEQEAVVYKPVELIQAYRDFDYQNPWMVGLEELALSEIKNKSEENK